MTTPIIHITNGVCRNILWRMKQPVNFEMLNNEHIAIVGPNGGGKSMLVDIIVGRHPLLGQGPAYNFGPLRSELISDNIQYITFRDTYGGDNDRTYFLQQRWNQTEIDQQTPTVGELLGIEYQLKGSDTEEHRQLREHLYDLFDVRHLLDKHIILLSSGEMRKFQLIRALLSNPRVLIMDNPFIGLDAQTRQQLNRLLEQLSQEKNLQIILVLSNTSSIPTFITHVVEVKEMIVSGKKSREEYCQQHREVYSRVLSEDKVQAILQLPYRNLEYHASEVVKMNAVTIRYGKRTILENLNWTVMNGERWALEGRNGSGKSTLLSLVCADNPQAYACDISLFGRSRGSGESIWDIKKHIGYVSPEMHRAYKKDLPAIRIVASGLKDSIGLYVKPDEQDYNICRWWMNIFGLEGMEGKTFLKLSSGEQRLILLARAFVKDPELLILDEPLHGLDDSNRRLVKDVIETFCQRRNKTLIMVTHYENELPNCITHRLCLQRKV